MNTQKLLDLKIYEHYPVEQKVEMYREAIKKYPEDEGTLQVMLFMVFNLDHQPKEAKQCVDRILELYDGKKKLSEDGKYSLKMAYHFKAHFLEEQPDKKEVIELEKKKIAISKKTAEGYTHLARAFRDDKDYENCKKTLDNILDMEPGHFPNDHYNKNFYWSALAEMYEKMKNYPEMIKCYEEQLNLTEYNFYDPQDIHEKIAKTMKKMGITEEYDEHGKSIEWLKKKIEVETDKTHLWMHYNNIALAYRGAKDGVNTTKSFQKAIEILDELINDPEISYNKIHFQKKQAEVHHAMGNTAKSIEINEDVAANQKDDQKRLTWKDLAEYHAEQNQLGKALEYYYKMLNLNKNDYQALEGLCLIYVHQKKFDLLKPICEQIIETNPDRDAKVYVMLATCYDEKNDHLKIIELFEQAAEVNADEDEVLASQIYCGLGNLYWKYLRDGEKAYNNYKKMMEFDPSEESKGQSSMYLVLMMNNPKGAEWADKFHKEFQAEKEVAVNRPLLTPEEIKALPYHHSHVTNDTVAEGEKKYNFKLEFEEDLKTNPKYQEYFKEYSPDSVQDFIKDYVKHKMQLLQNAKHYAGREETTLEIYHKMTAERYFELILQKKLFNMQLLWRAEKLTIPEIEIAADFRLIEYDVMDCMFIDKVTPKDIEVFKEHMHQPDFSEFMNYIAGWQDYDLFMQESDSEDETYMPAWYTFYDEKMGTGSLLSLPNIRGEKEEGYKQLFYRWNQDQPRVKPERGEPYVAPMWLKGMRAVETEYTKFMNTFENDYFLYLNQRHIDEKKPTYKNYDDDDFYSALEILKFADKKVPIEAGDSWYEEVIKAAKKHENEMMDEYLDDVYEEYLTNRELFVDMGIAKSKSENKSDAGLKMINRKTDADFILKGRELNGEPRDFNF